MKTIDLTTEKYSLSTILTLAKSGSVLIHSPSGENFLLEQADEFDREVAIFAESDKFKKFLEARSKESGEIKLDDLRKGMDIEG